MGRIQQFLLDTTLRLPASLLIRMSGEPQRKIGHRHLLPKFHLLCAQMSKQVPGFEEMSPDEARAMFNDQPVSLDRDVANPPTIKNHSIPVSGASIQVREYTPSGARGRRPALVYFHGGGWVIGNLESHHQLCARLATVAGIRVFSVDYRLAPESKFPIPLEDCEAAFEWVLSNAEKLGVDPSRVAAGGDSAGGNLTAALCLKRKSAGQTLPHMQLLIYPCTDFGFSTSSAKECAEGLFLTLEAMKWFRGHYLNTDEERMNPLASPLLAPDLSGLPPAMVITAGFDPLRDEGDAYAERLASAGVPVFHRSYDSFIHGFANMCLISEARSAVDEFAAELGKQLG